MGKFRIKISSSWYSKDYIILKYSINGFFWKAVKKAEYDILDNWYYMVNLSSHFSNAENLLNKFNSLDKIKKHKEEANGIITQLNRGITEMNERHNKNRRNAYKQFG